MMSAVGRFSMPRRRCSPGLQPCKRSFSKSTFPQPRSPQVPAREPKVWLESTKRGLFAEGSVTHGFQGTVGPSIVIIVLPVMANVRDVLPRGGPGAGRRAECVLFRGVRGMGPRRPAGAVGAALPVGAGV